MSKRSKAEKKRRKAEKQWQKGERARQQEWAERQREKWAENGEHPLVDRYGDVKASPPPSSLSCWL